MELFKKAKTIRLRSIKDKYMITDDDEQTVSQDRDGSMDKAEWEVFPTGERIIQTELKPDLDGSVNWEAITGRFSGST
ncbi:hypothetical protein Hanom_Chr11g01040071 [Helianthus anomalus]